MNASACGDCGDDPRHPGSVVRITGKDASGNTVVLCSRCFITREHDRRPAEPQLKAKGKRS